MLNGKTGRRIKKKKTKTISSTAEPEFNETLTFDLPASQIDTLQFLIILCSKVRKNLVSFLFLSSLYNINIRFFKIKTRKKRFSKMILTIVNQYTFE